MTDSSVENTSRTKVLCLIAMIVAVLAMQFSLIIMPGVATYIMPEVGLSPAQFGMLANTPYLAGLLFGIICGNWGDKIGIKKIVLIGIIVFIVGAWWRVFSGTFIMLFLSSLVMGFGLAVLNANSTKAIRLWYPGKSMGMAMGIYVAGASIGAGIALKCGAMWGTKVSFIVSAGLAVFSLIIWLLCYKTHPMEADDKSSTVGMAAFKSIMSNKYVWIASFMIMFIFGVSTTFQTYLNASLAIVSGGDLATVGTIALVSTIIVAASSVFGPSFIAKFKSLRGVLIIVVLLCGVFAGTLLLVPYGGLTWAITICFSLVLGTVLAMGKTVPALLPGIDPRNLGAVGGLHSTLQNLGGWLLCGYIIAPIAQGIYPSIDGGVTYGLDCYIAIYIGAAVCAVLVAICVLLLPKNTPSHLEIENEA